MELNEFHDFPPMYTIQPAEITREKQLRLWSELILKYYSSKGESVMIPGSFEHFTNPKIDRSLSEDGRLLVCDFMVNHGNAEWIDIKQKSRLRLIFKSVEVLASEIFKYADEIGLKNQVLTMYELHSGDEHTNTSFVGTDPILIERALVKLEQEGKCKIFSDENNDEKGVKFL